MLMTNTLYLLILRCGVPRRSLLGPMLLLLNIDDKPQAVNFDVFIYTDETRLLYQHKDPQ